MLRPQEGRQTSWPSTLLVFLRTVLLGANQQTSEYHAGARPFSQKRMAWVKVLIRCPYPPPYVNSLNKHSLNATFINAYCVASTQDRALEILDSNLRISWIGNQRGPEGKGPCFCQKANEEQTWDRVLGLLMPRPVPFLPAPSPFIHSTSTQPHPNPSLVI